MERVSLNILSTIYSAQSEHGLRSLRTSDNFEGITDYKRYASYCTRRLTRSRRRMGITSGSSKFTELSPVEIVGKTVFYKNQDEEENNESVELNSDNMFIKDGKIFTYLLFQAERAWANAMHIRQTIQKPKDSNTEVSMRARVHARSRLNKAAKLAENLVVITEKWGSEKTILEARAYASFMQGISYMEKSNWSEAASHLSLVETVYKGFLSESVSISPSISELYSHRLNEVEPLLRYCNYQMERHGSKNGDKEDIDSLKSISAAESENSLSSLILTRLNTVLNEERKHHAENFSEVSWLSRSIPLRSEKVRINLLKANENESELEKLDSEDGKIKLIEKILASYQEVKTIIKSDIGKMKKGEKSTKQESILSDLEYLLYYLTYQIITKTIARILITIESTETKLVKQDKELVSTLDNIVNSFQSILNHLEELESIPPVANNISMSKRISAQSFYYRGARVFYKARIYTFNNQYGKADLLFERALNHFDRALKQYNDVEKKILDSNEVERVVKSILKAKAKRSESLALNVLSSDKKSSGFQPVLMHRLDEWDGGSAPDFQLSNTVPDFEPIAPRAILYDLSHSDLPEPLIDNNTRLNWMDSTQETSIKESSGWLGGWFG